MAEASSTHRLFLLGAGFSAPAGLPLTSELPGLVRQVADDYLSSDDRYSHLANSMDRYEEYLAETDPSCEFDFEAFGAWLDWEHTLRLKGSDTWSEQGNRDGLQLRWAIGKVLHDRTPTDIPELYLDFAQRLTTSDRVLTLNYDLILERALTAVGIPFRRFPSRYSEVHDSHAVIDPEQTEELLLIKLHGSLDWTYSEREDVLALTPAPLVDGPRPVDDALTEVAVIAESALLTYYSNDHAWYRYPALLMPPSTAKPLARSPLVPLWDGAGLYAYMLGGFSVIGCSLPAGDPYVLQLAHHIATDYAAGRSKGGMPWPQRRMKLVDFRRSRVGRHELLERYRFMDPAQTDVMTDGFAEPALDVIFAEDDS